METLKEDDDEDTVVGDIFRILGAEKIGYLSLIHQLIVCEDSLNQMNGFRARFMMKRVHQSITVVVWTLGVAC